MSHKLRHITFTGIDGRTNPAHLAEIQKEYPLAEFGILTSYHWYENGNRYLDPRMIRKFLGKGLNLSLHICGSAAHDAALGNYGDIHHLTYGTYGYIPRIQLNLSERKDNPNVISPSPYGHEIIIQQRNVDNLKLFSSTQEKWRDYCGHLSVLLDASGGRGFDTPLDTVLVSTNKVGYAGGFNPDNVSDKLSFLLAHHHAGEFWIDMESGVRTDNWFDLDKVWDVLKKCRVCLDEKNASDMKYSIARQMLESILYDNDMVNREEPLDESRLHPWICKVSDCLDDPIAELGESFFTDEWIESFCCGDEDDIQHQIDLHPCLRKLSDFLNVFFENY